MCPFGGSPIGPFSKIAYGSLLPKRANADGDVMHSIWVDETLNNLGRIEEMKAILQKCKDSGVIETLKNTSTHWRHCDLRNPFGPLSLDGAKRRPYPGRQGRGSAGSHISAIAALDLPKFPKENGALTFRSARRVAPGEERRQHGLSVRVCKSGDLLIFEIF